MVAFWAFLGLGGNFSNLSWLIERRQVNVRVWVTADTRSLLPVLNDLGIQKKKKKKKNSLSGLLYSKIVREMYLPQF